MPIAIELPAQRPLVLCHAEVFQGGFGRGSYQRGYAIKDAYCDRDRRDWRVLA